MLINIISSGGCRGWEGNSVRLVKTEYTSVREYVIHEVLMNEYDLSYDESVSELDIEKNDSFGWSEYKDVIQFQDEEYNCEYVQFKPDNDYLEMIEEEVFRLESE
jgi:hypothetical protein